MTGRIVDPSTVREYGRTINYLIDREWLVQEANAVTVTNFGEVVMVGLCLNFFRVASLPNEMPDQELLTLPAMKQAEVVKLLDVLTHSGLIKTAIIKGEDVISLTDAGVDFSVSIMNDAIRDGMLEHMLDLLQEDLIREKGIKAFLSKP